MPNQSDGPIILFDNSVTAINLALLQIQERLDGMRGLRGPTRIFTRVEVDNPEEAGDAVNLGSELLLLDEAALFAEVSQAQGIKEVLQAVQDTLAGSLLAIEADRRRAEAEIRNALDQMDLAGVFAPVRTADLTLGNDLPLSVETAASAGIAPRSSRIDHVHPGVNLDDAQSITARKTFVTDLLTPLVLGSVASGGTLTLQSTEHATKGKLLFGTSAYDEVNNRLGIQQTTPTDALHVGGALRIDTSTLSSYTTPVGSAVPTKIHIPNFDPGSFGQLLALGLNSSATSTARAILLCDQRVAGHQPTLTILSPDEAQLFGFSWNGSNVDAAVTSTKGIALDATGLTSFTTPAASGVPAKIRIPSADPGNFGQILAMGIPAGSSTSARCILMCDGRTVAHQPTFLVLSPDENELLGFTWDGSNTLARLLTTQSLALYVNGADRLTIDTSGNVGIGTGSPTKLLDVNDDRIRVRTAFTPANAAAAGNQGDIAWDSSYFYTCISSNTWHRVAHATW